MLIKKRSAIITSIVLVAVIVMVAACSILLSLYRSLPKKVDYRSLQLKTAVAVVGMNNASKEDYRFSPGGFVIALSSDGTSAIVPVKAINPLYVLWNRDGLYFADSEFDYFIGNQSSISQRNTHPKKTKHLVGMFENSHKKVMSVTDLGFTQQRANQLEFIDITHGNKSKPYIKQARMYDAIANCANGTHMITLNDKNQFILQRIDNASVKPWLLKQNDNTVYTFNTIHDDTAPCINNTITMVASQTVHSDNNKDITGNQVGLGKWNTDSGTFTFTPLSLDGKTITADNSQRSFEILSYGSATLHNNKLIILDDVSGKLYEIDPTTSTLEHKWSAPNYAASHNVYTRYKMRANKQTISIIDTALGEGDPHARIWILDKQNYHMRKSITFDRATSYLLAQKTNSHIHFQGFAVNPNL